MRTLWLSLCVLTLAMTACKGDEPAGDSSASSDFDGDGYAQAEDCDDDNATVNPGADELCDSLDNNCDGLIDVDPIDPQTFYGDEDEDGYAGDAVTVSACEAPEGFSDTMTDCDDLRADVNPAADERCDGADNDCDGLTDDEDTLAPGEGSAWLLDDDGDGFGDSAAATVTACVAPAGYVAEGGDCDSADAAINPGAPETCDALDNDCDGLTDDDDPSVGDRSTWYADADADTFGSSSSAEACDTPSGYVADMTDCDDLNADVNPAATEICDGGVDNDCDGLADDDDPSVSDRSTWYADADADTFGSSSSAEACVAPTGYVADTTDCDDLNADVNPAATEICDGGVDNDCDGLGDDDDPGVSDRSTWYADDDGDTFGSSSSAEACDAPSGYVADTTDCDDLNADVNPAATEICDGDVDNDCDGLADDDDPSVSDLSTWYADDDGDTFGGGTSAEACVAPSGYVADMTDCDDLNADVNPAATEICDGDVDNDCDGLTEDDDPSVDTRDGITVYLDGDGDGFGVDGSGAMFCALPSGYSTLDGDCDDSSATVSPDGVEVCDNGIDEDCSGDAPGCGVSGTLSVTDVGITLTDSLGSGLGYDIGAGDINGDGDDDLVIGAPFVDIDSANWTGRSYVIYGPLTVDRTVTSSYDASVDGNVTDDYVGLAVSAGGDLNGDGYDDIAIGSLGYDLSAASDAGIVGVRYGSAASLSGNTSIDALDANFTGIKTRDYLGFAVKFIGDVNGDGYDELAAGARGASSTYPGAGAVYIIQGSATRYSGISTMTTAAALTITGATRTDSLGDMGSIAGPVELDGDGLHDIVVGSITIKSGANTRAGGAYVFYGTAGALSTSASLSIAAADASFTGGAADDVLGGASASAGDVNGDGYNDLVLGAYGVDNGSTLNVGCAYLLHGGASRLSGASSVTSAAVATICGEATSDSLGATVGGADVNGDGYSDMFVGANGVDNGTSSNVGAMYVFYGSLSGSVSANSADATFTGTTFGGNVGLSSHVADVNGDGNEDILVGAQLADTVYALFGGGL